MVLQLGFGHSLDDAGLIRCSYGGTFADKPRNRKTCPHCGARIR